MCGVLGPDDNRHTQGKQAIVHDDLGAVRVNGKQRLRDVAAWSEVRMRFDLKMKRVDSGTGVVAREDAPAVEHDMIGVKRTVVRLANKRPLSSGRFNSRSRPTPASQATPKAAHTSPCSRSPAQSSGVST